MNIVTPKDWYRTGLNDGTHGNPKFPPKGKGASASRAEYLKGYEDGVKARAA